MIHILAPDRILSRTALDISSAPRPVLWRGLGLAPRRPMFGRLFWRLVIEQSLPRYLIALIPFPIAMMIWPDLALPIAQAPLFMFALVYIVENNVLAISDPAKRRALVDPDDAARGLDMFRARARRVLAQVAAGLPDDTGPVHLVVEQSPLNRLAVVTLISIQRESPPAILPLAADAQKALTTELFDTVFSDADLHKINLAEGAFLRSVRQSPEAISAHARLAALAKA